MTNVQGIILINKNSGKSSAAVVSQVRRLLGMKRVGHCGTLDPFATGVLPIVFGRATAAVPYMTEYDKDYRCQIQLGARTDTMDRAGEITAQAPSDFDNSKLENVQYIEQVLNSFLGEIKQQAPLYSAVKVKGKALYKYARQGQDVERPWRTVTVHAIKLLDIYRVEEEKFPRLDVSFSTSKGTYIRSLADAIGEKLGCYAYATELERIACGPFTLDQTVQIEDLFEKFEKMGHDSGSFLPAITAAGIVRPTKAAFVNYPEHALRRSEAIRMAHGREIKILSDEVVLENMIFIFKDVLVAIGNVNQGVVKVRRVFIDNEADIFKETGEDEDI